MLIRAVESLTIRRTFAALILTAFDVNITASLVHTQQQCGIFVSLSVVDGGGIGFGLSVRASGKHDISQTA